MAVLEYMSTLPGKKVPLAIFVAFLSSIRYIMREIYSTGNPGYRFEKAVCYNRHQFRK